MFNNKLSKANDLFLQKKYKEAEKLYQSLVEAEPKFFVYHENLGRLYNALGELDKAEKAYHMAASLSDKALAAHHFKTSVADAREAQKAKTKANKNKHPVELLKDTIASFDVEPLRKAYYESPLSKEEDTFVLVRVIGNDLYPRHKVGQTRENVEFILKHEPAYESCQKLWIVNRIVDNHERDLIHRMLTQYGQDFVDIPFEEDVYSKIPFDRTCLPSPDFLYSDEYNELGPKQKDRLMVAMYRRKNCYVMNNNGARNTALREGKKRAKWVLPWDGNCYLTPDAWGEIKRDVLAAPWFSHFVVPMARMLSNQDLVDNKAPPDPVEEPQLIFRRDTVAEFNENFPYGRRPKVEMFWSLGIPGKWDNWKDDPWEQQRRGLLDEARKFGLAGWVARLYSGMGNLEKDSAEAFRDRGLVRQEAILAALREIDKTRIGLAADKDTLQIYRDDALIAFKRNLSSGSPEASSIYDELIKRAEEALTRGPYSVTDKTTLPPSGNLNDYWHPAPYWWPDPDKPDGLPYIPKDGLRVPGTEMYDPESEKFDRTRVQRVFDDSITLMLAYEFSRDKRFAEHSVKIFDRFFINKDTAMAPHLLYAQVRMGRNKNMGSQTGLIELKDFYFYFDALRLMKKHGLLTESQQESFNCWLTEYADYLQTSKQGVKERRGKNNHGTYYDLHLLSVAAYLGDEGLIYSTIARAASRISEQFTVDGEQPDELARTTSKHYCFFNLQGFLYIALYAKNWGVDLFNYEDEEGKSIRKVAEWVLSYWGKDWPYEQINEFDEDRFSVVHNICERLGLSVMQPIDLERRTVKSVISPHYAVFPFHNIANLAD